MVDNKTKKSILKKILSCSEFQKKDKYHELLEYLVTASIEGKQVKEATIAIDVFGKGKDFDPVEDPTVRVYVSNLRKKLEHYYLTSGVNDKIHVEIPKGHYNVIFAHQKLKSRLLSPKKTRLFLAINFLFIVFFIVLSAGFYIEKMRLKERFHLVSKSNFVWGDFLNSKKPILLVVGDYFFMTKTINDGGESRRVFFRDPRINSLEEFDQKGQKFAEQFDLTPLEFTYCRPSVSACMVELVPVLKQARMDAQVILASELNWVDLEGSNIVYIGSFKTLYLLEKLLEKNYVKYDLGPYRLMFYNKNWDCIKTFKTESPMQGEYQKDYSLISKFEGPEDNSILILAGFDEIGILQATKMATSQQFPTMLKNQIPDSIPHPFYFKLVVESEGYRRTGFAGKIVFFDYNK